jgi:hypothetical protein
MKSFWIKTLTIGLMAGSFVACADDDYNEFRPGSTHNKTPEEETVTTGYESLTATNHPRLLMNADAFASLKEKINSGANANLSLLHTAIMTIAKNKGLATSQLTYTLDASNKRILDVSRSALTRIFADAYAYRITGEQQYLTHAEADINAVCAFSDWNSKRHFLDVGEMATAVALGYDWLYNELSEDTRKNAVNALTNFALVQAQNKNWNLDFYAATSNWNQVCNAGLVCAALAIYESNPTLCKQMIEKSVESNATAIAAMYSPDGNYPEGPSYWCYGTLYQTLMLSALESTLGTDSGLSDISGFSKTGEYMLYTLGMNDKFFNYSDCGSSAAPGLASWWFADKYQNPSLLYNELIHLKNGKYATSDESRLLPMLMAFANNIDLSNVSAPTSKIWSGKGETPVVMIHTDWTYSASDRYLGIKAGKANTSHGHMDAGSFVYDANGVRWSMDFGLQSYTTLESKLTALGGNLWDMTQSSMRWDVFRLNNLNHSTISVNDAKHKVSGAAEITSIINSNNELGAVLNMTPVLVDEVASATRTVKLVNEKDLVVIDEVKAQPGKSAVVRWCMVTTATPTVETGGITLKYGGQTMYLSAKGTFKPSYKTWSTTSTNSYDATNPGTYMVGFEATVTPNQTGEFTTTLSETSY